NVLATGPCEAANYGRVIALTDGLGYRPDAVIIADRRNREAGLEHIDAQLSERLGHADLLVDVHRKAGRLLTIAQRGVEDNDAVFFQLAEAGMFNAHCGSGP